jgi:hypothetical protein
MPPRIKGSRAQEGEGMRAHAMTSRKGEVVKAFSGEEHNPGRRPNPPKKKLEAAMRETHTNIPSTVERADVSPERKEAMKRAIAFKKAREGK